MADSVGPKRSAGGSTASAERAPAATAERATAERASAERASAATAERASAASTEAPTARATADDIEAARGSAGTDPRSADLAVSVLGRLFRLAPQLTELLDLGAREYGMGFARGRVLWALQESGPVVMRAL